MRNLVSGSFAGALGTLVGQPLDTVKVRLQTHSTPTGIVSFIARTLRSERLSSFYSGVTPALAAALTENAVVFAANGAIKAAYSSIFDKTAEGGHNYLSLTEHACIGGMAGVFSATAITPLEQIKVRLQCNKGRTRAMTIISQAVKCDGLRGLFRGLGPTILRDIPFNFTFFGMYETSCHVIAHAHQPAVGKNELSNAEILLAGGIAGCAGWTVSMPMDVIKSVVQSQKSSKLTVVSAAKQIIRQYGVAGLYLGWSAAMLRAFPTNASVFYGYEMCARFFDDQKKTEHA